MVLPGDITIMTMKAYDRQNPSATGTVLETRFELVEYLNPQVYISQWYLQFICLTNRYFS